MEKGDEGLRSVAASTHEENLGKRDELGGGVSPRVARRDLSDVPRCIHRIFKETCSLCLGHPQTAEVRSGPPKWFVGGDDE